MLIDGAPTATDVNDAAGFVERLGRLRIWAGKPSLRRLAALAGTTVTSDGHIVDRLPPSTVSDVLAGKRLPHMPRMDLVGAFVTACLRECQAPPDVAENVVAEWLTQWRRLAGATAPAPPAPPAYESRDNGRVGPVRRGVEITRGKDRPLVGRKDALREFGGALDEAAAGSAQIVAVVGEPGAGKTRLLAELAAMATDRGLVTLWGRSGEFEQEMPLGVVVDALDDHLEGRGDWVQDRLGVERARQLSAVLPALSVAAATGHVPAGSSLQGESRYRVFRAVRRLLEELAVPSGVVMILDDIHWADAASVEFVDHLLRHPPRGGVLLATAYRPAQVAPQLTALIESGFGHVRQVPVDPLTLAEAEEFVGPSAGRAWCRRLHAASGGNAFYLEALARMGDREPLARSRVDFDEKLDGGSELPHAVRAAVEVELHGLSPAALLVAKAAAVAANEFDTSVVAVAAEVDNGVVLAGLDEMSARDIVRPASSGGRFQFRHPLIRSVVYGMAAPGWRLAAHARIAAHLAGTGAPATARARHVERSAAFGDRTAVATLVAAARMVARHAPAAAVHWLSAALRLLPAGLDDPDGADFRIDLLLELARLQALTGRWMDGREITREALRLLPPGDHARRARVIRFATTVERHLGNPNEARLVLLDELHRLPNPKSAEAAPLRLRLAAEGLLRSDYRAAQATLDDLPDTDEEWEPGLALAIAAMRPLPALAGLRVAEAIGYVEVAAQMEIAAPDEHLAEWLDAITWLCWTETFLGRHRNAQRRFERAVAIARATDHYIIGLLMAGQARTYAMLGELTSAATLAEEAVEEARLVRLELPMAMALAQQCLAASWSGDDAAALRLADQAASSGQGGEWQDSLAQYARAVALINAGRLDEGAAGLRTTLFSKPKLDPLTQLSACELMAHAEAERGRTGEAVNWADRADRLTHLDLPISLGLARLARAHALRTTAPAAAAEHARQAADLLTAAELVIDAGRARLCSGTLYADLGETDRAREQLRQATDIFAACGARALHAQATRHLHRVT